MKGGIFGLIALCLIFGGIALWGLLFPPRDPTDHDYPEVDDDYYDDRPEE